MNVTKISLSVIDHAFDQAMEEQRAVKTSGEYAAGHNHGVRLLRQRFGGQFLRNQGHFITLEQQAYCAQILRAEIANKTAPSLDLDASKRSGPDYWLGVDQGVTDYDRNLTAAAAPDAPQPLPRRRRQP